MEETLSVLKCTSVGPLWPPGGAQALSWGIKCTVAIIHVPCRVQVIQAQMNWSWSRLLDLLLPSKAQLVRNARLRHFATLEAQAAAAAAQQRLAATGQSPVALSQLLAPGEAAMIHI